MLRQSGGEEPSAKRYDFRIDPRTWRGRLQILGVFVAVIALMFGAIAILALSEGGSQHLTIENRTTVEVSLLIDHHAEMSVPSGETIDTQSYRLEWDHGGLVQIIDETGHKWFESYLTTSDLDRMNHHITVGD